MRNLVFASALLLSLSAFAQSSGTDQPQPEAQKAAPADVISNAKEMCMAWAKDDGVEPELLNDYLLGCINNELSYDNYQPITSLD